LKLRKIDPRKIVVPEVRVTSRFDPETLVMLKDSIKAEGLIAPIICCQVEEKFVLVDGLHRLQEAITQQLPIIDVAVTEGTMIDVLTRNLFMDHIRGKHPVSEMVQVIESLTKDYGLDSDAIAKKTGMTREYVENLQLISRLTPMIRAAIDDGSLKVTPALELTRLKSPEAQEEYFLLYRQFRWNTQTLHEYISERLAILETPPPPMSPAPPPAPHTAECVYCHGQFDLSQLSNPTTCIGCFTDMVRSMLLAQTELAKEVAAAAKEAPSPKE